MNSGVNILFYSKKCPTCINVLNLLQNEKLLGYFKLFCVDERLNNLPPYIKVVPTMVVSDINKPLVMQEIFEYIQRIKFMRQKNMMDMNKRIIQQNLINTSQNTQSGPIGFKESEMSSISDTFAYTQIDMPMAQSFVNVNDKHAIFTPPLQKDEVMNKATQEQLINSLENTRKEQEKEYNALLKQKRLDAIMKAEQKNPSMFM
ncbi:MAG: hypothetical protein Homavirus13_3 [Homavirus sp.]|uniref:Thioredoxin n=1 Tax=Homavirus sp. TaxID=2487769 RepID=A0A3G5A6R4_9VIRU|nr:MAG: hypothetical protein Homavirus13_3 [Homavirus sp.]